MRTTFEMLRDAIEFAPASGPVAPELRGLWVHTDEGDEYVCAPCVGRITARGMGHLFTGCERVWRDDGTPYGVCRTCSAHAH